jgi:hypothetical protein
MKDDSDGIIRACHTDDEQMRKNKLIELSRDDCQREHLLVSLQFLLLFL